MGDCVRTELSIRLTTSAAHLPSILPQGLAAGMSAWPRFAFRLVNPIDTGPSLRPARDDSGSGIIGLDASIRANTECVGECRDRRGGAVV